MSRGGEPLVLQTFMITFLLGILAAMDFWGHRLVGTSFVKETGGLQFRLHATLV